MLQRAPEYSLGFFGGVSKGDRTSKRNTFEEELTLSPPFSPQKKKKIMYGADGVVRADGQSTRSPPPHTPSLKPETHLLHHQDRCSYDTDQQSLYSDQSIAVDVAESRSTEVRLLCFGSHGASFSPMELSSTLTPVQAPIRTHSPNTEAALRRHIVPPYSPSHHTTPHRYCAHTGPTENGWVESEFLPQGQPLQRQLHPREQQQQQQQQHESNHPFNCFPLPKAYGKPAEPAVVAAVSSASPTAPRSADDKKESDFITAEGGGRPRVQSENPLNVNRTASTKVTTIDHGVSCGGPNQIKNGMSPASGPPHPNGEPQPLGKPQLRCEPPQNYDQEPSPEPHPSRDPQPNREARRKPHLKKLRRLTATHEEKCKTHRRDQFLCCSSSTSTAEGKGGCCSFVKMTKNASS